MALTTPKDMGKGAIHPSKQADGGSGAGVMLPPFSCGCEGVGQGLHRCGVDVVVKQYDNFAFAAGAWRYAGGCDGHADGTYACAV